MFEKMCGLHSVATNHNTGNPTSLYIVENDAEQEIVSSLLLQSGTQLKSLFEDLHVHSSVQNVVEENLDLFVNPPDDFIETISSLLIPILASKIELIKDFNRVVCALMEQWQILMRAHFLNLAVQKVFHRRRDVAQLMYNIEALMRSKNMI